MTSKIALQYHGLRKVVFVSFASVVIVSLLGALFICWFRNTKDDSVKILQAAQQLQTLVVKTFDDEINFVDWDSTTQRSNIPHESTTKFDYQQAFVKPVKIKSQSKTALDYDDNETENSGNESPFLSKYTSNFRHENSEIWDTTPEYEFEAFSRRFHIILNQQSKFIRPDLKIMFVSKNSSTQHQLDVNPNCYYSGSLKDEPASSVTVNLCDGMRGHIRSHNDGTYSIEPAETSNNNTDAFYHILRRIDSNYETRSVNGKSCTTQPEHENIFDDPKTYLDINDNNIEPLYSIRRRKRSTHDDPGEYTIELLIAVDKKVAQFHGEGLKEYILTIMREVNKIFKDNSIDNSINVVLVKWVQMEDDYIVRDYEHENTVMLDLFCDWQFKNNNYDDNSPDHHDVAVLITRDMICSYDRSQCDSFLGLAQLGHVCSNNGKKSCAAVKDNGIYTAFTVAHELGHILNIPHDEDVKCARHRGANEPVKIMTQKSNPEADPWAWSACSRYFLSEFLEAGNVECLHDNPLTESHKVMTITDYPGETYSADKQCEMIYGEGWRMYQRGENCSMLWCYNPDSKVHPRSESGPWADGTLCGPNHWCRRKRCVPRSPVEKVVHGGWSEWQPYGECTRTCGGGVRKSQRFCNNPKNSNGGDYCKGNKVRYQSCNMHECPPQTPDFRLQQCAKFNNDTSQWVPVPHYRQNSERNRCILVCNETNTGEVHPFNEYVIDGTFCDKDLNYGVCVNGKCLKTGCDHKLHSNLIFDNCGICGGNNSTCISVNKSFNKQTSAGYTFIDTIPAGASSIDIQQYSHNGTLDDNNYLALKDPLTKNYILNGEYSLSRVGKELFFEGITIQYGGTLANPERIKTFNRLPRDLVLEILSSSNAPPFKIVCQYILPMAAADYFKWEVTDDWTNCDKVCNGEQEKIIRCIKKETGNAVYSESCAGLRKPQTDTRICNEFCTLRWKTVGQTECSTPCGQGVRKLTYRCYRENRSDTPNSELLNVYCAHIEKPPEEEACWGPCTNAHWQYDDWEPCSVSCGKGVQKRQARCVDDSDREVDESACSLEEKRSESACYMDKCPQWSYSVWSPCSVTCGKGVRKRQTRCEQNNRIVNSEFCRNLAKPTTHETCEMPPCATWLTGEWSECSVSCGDGSMVRAVRCSASNELECPEQLRPEETQYCYLHPCTEDPGNDIPSSNDVTFTHEDKYQWKNGSWSECSTTFSKGICMRQRSVKCYNMFSETVVEDEFCILDKIPPAMETCEERFCAQWKTSRWSSCSVTCGRGIIARRVWCDVDGKRVNERVCSESKPVESRTCEESTCPTTTETSAEPVKMLVPSKWRVGRWRDCSVTCGGGMKNRNVVCLDTRGTIASDCIDHLRPASSSPCNTNPCADQVKWKYGEWSQCNKTCGGGYQHRQVQCASTNGENVPETFCRQYERPQLIRECENNPCSKITYQWQSTLWSECSVTCGIGVYTRSVQCNKIDEYNIQFTEVVSDSFCTSTRPISEKECLKEPCQKFAYSYKWNSSPWSECSVTCGSGIQERRIDCHKISDNNAEDVETVAEHHCDKATRPPNHQQCQSSLCPNEFFWVTGPWSECTGPCGNKRERRKLYCYRNFENVHRSLCRHLVKPKRRRKCPQHKCEPSSCLDIKQKYRTGRDHEYILNILGRNISIYCHEMKSSHPKEYLSLKVSTLENYSEYYAKRLKDPDSCPYRRLKMTHLLSKEDNNSLAALEEDNSFAGKTVFRKLRLNVTSMQVIMNDYNFAITYGYSIPVGQAGDCYSKQNCAQGTFSINVAGTGLRIASSVHWETVGSHATMDVKFLHERRKAVGKCGGYCAMCRPSHGLKLDVLPP